MIAIKHRFSGTTLCEFDVTTLKEAVEKGKTNLYGANLRGANLRGANLYGANLYGADLYCADLRGANLRGANLYGANLYGANLYCADLGGADLGGANLRGADLRGADLGGANLYGANLRGANLYGADLGGADLGGANLRGANLRGANLGEKFGKLVEGGVFTAGPLGSRGDHAMAFHTDKGIFVKAGCFFDSLDAFRAKVIAHHGETSKHGKLYIDLANMIEYKFQGEE